MSVLSHTCSITWEFTHHVVWEMYWISASRKIFKKSISLECFSITLSVLPYFFHHMEIHLSHVLGTAWISVSQEKNMKPLRNVCVFPNFRLTIEIHFSHILEIIQIKASQEICEKLVALEYLCFPIRFLYYGNSFFPCFGNCMDFCFTWNIKETHNFKCLCFSILSPYHGNSLFSCFGNCIDFSLHDICKKSLTLECSVFPYFSLAIGIHCSHAFGTMLLIWKLIKIFYLLSHFH